MSGSQLFIGAPTRDLFDENDTRGEVFISERGDSAWSPASSLALDMLSIPAIRARLGSALAVSSGRVVAGRPMLSGDMSGFNTWIRGWTLEVVVHDGNGTVTSSPAGIDCGSASCSAVFADATAVTLTATPATGYRFKEWSGDCTGTAVTCDVATDQDRNVAATFEVDSDFIFADGFE